MEARVRRLTLIIDARRSPRQQCPQGTVTRYMVAALEDGPEFRFDLPSSVIASKLAFKAPRQERRREARREDSPSAGDPSLAGSRALEACRRYGAKPAHRFLDALYEG